MRRSAMQAAALLAALTVCAAPGAAAQAVSLLVGGGIAAPLNDAGRNLDAGPTVTLGVVAIPTSVPLGFELSGRWQRIAGSTPEGGIEQPGLQVLDLSANVLYRLKWSLRASVRPWVTAGLGAYRLEPVGSGVPAGAEATTRVGLNGGAGIAVPAGPVALSVEGRFHTIFTRSAHTNLFSSTLALRVPLHRPARREVGFRNR
ncbi:MAG TPA: outer membrane beta-barrel protein [Gemmatimonadales bacterium]|nr:outer membrane beta-barrel protein [Gemmatimonadales bacterium]